MVEPRDDLRPYALVVDDDALLRMDVAEILDHAGFRTMEAESGDAAIAVLEQRHLDIAVLFSDVEMPGSRNGFALAREACVRWPYVAIVIASGRLKPADGDMPDGARFIGKPFSAETVHSHLREILPDDRKPEPLRRPS
ncbi:response regulator [Lichenibacterium ramalinae]|uniref:Response regulator n=1 Tax=Lichenibacterium ramalinae TaxID=2316527 RepID=A0A4Q2RA34_9HYPH|nr:response regulator [Lichenibacterium ramalinae]RYB02410.1 response regulator [Lichenibacterium ramalinae]